MTDVEFRDVIKNACPELDDKGVMTVFKYVKSIQNSYDKEHLIEDSEYYNVAAVALLTHSIKPPKRNKIAEALAYIEDVISSNELKHFTIDNLLGAGIKLYGKPLEQITNAWNKPKPASKSSMNEDEWNLIKIDKVKTILQKLIDKKSKPENVYYLFLRGEMWDFYSKTYNTKIDIEYNDNILQYDKSDYNFNPTELVTKIIEYDYPVKTDKINVPIFIADNYTYWQKSSGKTQAKKIRNYEILLSPNYDPELTRKYIKHIINKEGWLDDNKE